MKTILLSLLLPVMAMAQTTNREVSGTIAPGLSAESNLATNRSCRRSINGITNASSILTRNTTTPLENPADCQIDAASSTQLVAWPSRLTATLAGTFLKNATCEAGFTYSGDATLYKTYVTINSVKQTVDLQLTNATNPQSVSMIFPCGDLTNAPAVAIEATGNGAIINVAKVYIGKPRNVGVAPAGASLFGTISWASTASCAWATANVGYTNYTADTDCPTPSVTGNLKAPSTKIPGFSYDSLPAGNYLIVATGGFFKAGASSTSFYRFFDGTVGGGDNLVGVNLANNLVVPVLSGSMAYSAAQPAGTIQIQGSTTSGSGSTQIDVTAAAFTINVYYFPNFSAQNITQDISGWYIDATINGGDPDLGTASVSSFTEMISSALTMTPASGSAPIGIMCSSTNAATAPSTGATTCAAGSESVGGNFYIPQPGTYKVCFEGSDYVQLDQGVFTQHTFELIETPTNAQTLTLQGGSIVQTNVGALNIATGSNAVGGGIVNNCSYFNWSNKSTSTPIGVRLMYQQTVTGTPDISFLLGGNPRVMKIRVERVVPIAAAPIFANGVITSSPGVARVSFARFGGASDQSNCGSSPCTVYTGGTPDVTGATRSGTGLYTAAIAAGTFSAKPACTCSAQNNSGNSGACSANATSATSVDIAARSDTGTLVDTSVSLNCQQLK